MAVVELTVQEMLPAGLAVAFVAAAAAGNSFVNNGRTFLRVRNGGGAAITVTVVASGRCDQTFLHPETVSIPAGGERDIGAFAIARFSDTTGRVTVTYSAVTTVTVAAIRL